MRWRLCPMICSLQAGGQGRGDIIPVQTQRAENYGSQRYKSHSESEGLRTRSIDV